MTITNVKKRGDTGYTVTTSDEGTMYVPVAEGNRHYQEIKAWIAEGNTPEAEFTEEELATKALESFKTEVKAALDATTTTVLRCYQAGISFPTEWKEYVDALRTLLNATEVTTLPTRPDYPAGS